MSVILISEKKNIFLKVIELAKKREFLENNSSSKGGSLEEIINNRSTVEGKAEKESYEALNDYINSLSLDEIIILQTVMYIGRYEDYDPQKSPEENFESFKAYLYEQGVKDKTIESSQIIQKVPLATYLEKGLEILKTKL